MPIYEVKCPECNKVEELFSQVVLVEGDQRLPKCPSCQVSMVKMLSRLRKDSWPQDGLVLDHIAEKPMHFKTKKQLRQYCKEKGFSSAALL